MTLSAADISGILGMVPTPSTADADDWRCTRSVDLDETARMAARITAGGVTILITNGSLGEGATLIESEHRDFTACIADTISGRGLLFAGVTTLNTRDTITRARLCLEAGADGLFLGRPMWLSLDHRAIVRYYADLAEALPGVPFILYDNQFAFKAKIATETYLALAENRAIIATKHIGGPSIADDVRAVGDRIRVLPLDSQWASLARAFPEQVTACWTGNAADGTEPLVALDSAVRARDWERADAITTRMAWAQAPMFPGGKLENFVDYNIPIAHARIAGSGLVRSGPPRPPYLFAPDDYIAGGIETGRRWASIRSEFSEAPQARDNAGPRSETIKRTSSTRQPAVPPDNVPDACALLRARAPRVQCLTNTVAQAITANGLHALGASASMAAHSGEIVGMTASADAVLINLGTIDAIRLDALDRLLENGALAGKPIVLDPVFVQHSPLRLQAAVRLARQPGVIIKGNAAEIAALATALGGQWRRDATIVTTGIVDRVETDGRVSAEIAAGHPFMAQVTGLGCALGAAIAAFASVIERPADAAAMALTVFGKAGERAAAQSRGPGSFAVNFIDQLASAEPAPEART